MEKEMVAVILFHLHVLYMYTVLLSFCIHVMYATMNIYAIELIQSCMHSKQP